MKEKVPQKKKNCCKETSTTQRNKKKQEAVENYNYPYPENAWHREREILQLQKIFVYR